MIATRSPIVQLGIRAATPLAVVVAVYLFFSGHNRPGGGFAAGLVLGAVVALRTVAGMRRPDDATALLAVGGVIAGAAAMAPLLWGDLMLDQVVVERAVPILGTIKTGTALVFDTGVALIVIGLVVAVLNGLGAEELGAGSPERSAS